MFIFHTLQEYLFPEPTKQRKPLHSLVRHGYSLTWFKYIFACLRPTEHENLKLRRSCKLFSEILKPLPCWTSFPHLKYASLKTLFARFDALEAPPPLLLIEDGTHNEGGNIVDIKRPMSIVGESRERCIVLGGLEMKGKKGDDINVSNLTLRKSKGYGVYGNRGASIHLDNVSVEYSGRNGVFVYGTERSTMKNCNVSHSKWSGLVVYNNGLMTISGTGTTIQHNCTDGLSGAYGLNANSDGSIHLASSLTIEAISTDNGGGGNYGGDGTIAIVHNEGLETIQKRVYKKIPHYYYDH